MSEEASTGQAVSHRDHTHSVQRLMRRQAALSLRVAIIFIVLLIGLPLLNVYAKSAMATPEAGFTLTWLVLGVLFFPITWVLSAYFVKRSDELESQLAAEARAEEGTK